MAVVYLELQNVSDVANPVFIDVAPKAIRCEVVDASGAIVPQTSSPASIWVPPPYTLLLPHDSTLRFRVSVSGWGIPKGPGLALQLASGFWFLSPGVSDGRFLSCTLSIPEPDPQDLDSRHKDMSRGRVWRGNVALPKLEIRAPSQCGAVSETPPNTRVNPPVRPVTALAKTASAAPARPAGYAQR
jgi:hypothetical protein